LFAAGHSRTIVMIEVVTFLAMINDYEISNCAATPLTPLLGSDSFRFARLVARSHVLNLATT
jgi:hypothetical protein